MYQPVFVSGCLNKAKVFDSNLYWLHDMVLISYQNNGYDNSNR